MNRKEILEAAMSYVTVDREAQYGSPEDNFKLVAGFWHLYLCARFDTAYRNGKTVETGDGEFDEYVLTAEDVANMMSLLKIARIATGQKKNDNYADLAGYAACAGEIATKKVDMQTCSTCRFDKDDPNGEYEPCRSCENWNNWEMY